jgi:hypothetical protein
MRAERLQHPSTRFWGVLCWEFLQNLPLIASFLLTLHFWQHARLGPAVACAIAGGLAGSLVIWATESRIVEGHHESPRVVLANVAVMAGLMLVLSAYLAASWSRWWMDLALGVVAGMMLGAVQDLAAGASIGARHCLALALAFALGLVEVRLLVTGLPLLWSILVITAGVTVTIVGMDYKALWGGHQL